MPLKITTKFTHYASAKDLEDLINETYSTDDLEISFSLNLDQVWSEDHPSSYTPVVSPISFKDLKPYEQKRIEHFFSRDHEGEYVEGEYVAHLLLNDLCFKGIIPAGAYVFAPA